MIYDDLPEVNIPWSTVGYLTFKRTYARKFEALAEEADDATLLDADAPTEEFADSTLRVVNAANSQFGVGFTSDEQIRLAGYLLSLKGSVGGRFWWQAGTKTVDRFGLGSLQNCAFTLVDSPIRPFTWTMDMLAMGSGVGFNIQRHHVANLPKVASWFEAPTRVNDNGADFIVPDSREGWVRLLGKTLKAAFLSQSPRKGSFTFATTLVRSKGAPIKGFGGTASGPEDLVWGINQIAKVLEKRRGRFIRPIDALDIMNIIAWIIVAGNVRRSAMIAIGDPDDVEFLLAKRWDMGNIPKWRAMSNNSVACDDLDDLHPYFWDTYEKGANGLAKSEAYGLINLKLSRSCGRLGETEYPDPLVEGYNPCAEQSLEPFETCCLSEVFLPNLESIDEMKDVCRLLYRVNKHSLTLGSHNEETETVVHKNLRMGIGLTGILQASEEQLTWLDEVYKDLREYDVEYSAAHGFPISIKLTTIKPSGTLSLLPGVTPGIHPGFAKFMYRRITIASDHPLVQVCKQHGYPIEYKLELDGSQNLGSMIATFPFKYPDGTVLAEDMTALRQLETIRLFQTIWSDNSVSCTIYYSPEELPEIKAYLVDNYHQFHKTLSFMLHEDHGFVQAPFEEVTEKEYNALVDRTTIITEIATAGEFDEADGSECVGGACPVR